MMIASQQLDIKRESLRRIVHAELNLNPCDIQMHQPLNDVAKHNRSQFAFNMNERLTHSQIEIDKKNLDEAHFYIEGYVNEQNRRIWCSELPYITMTKSLLLIKVTVCCGYVKSA
ncbi:hypothetical protein RF11_09268 [Thelohanellus kitauei]|uniref:Uncharacterized protein n=1 Tax=Thelohanellus kitauei TaxID=669202 RepID=A0A0C2J6R2_THEKT|nr:hypothetical protein RF11_09268 [Thelohanellus kitauei]